MRPPARVSFAPPLAVFGGYCGPSRQARESLVSWPGGNGVGLMRHLRGCYRDGEEKSSEE